jgi:hypothetical protein
LSKIRQQYRALGALFAISALSLAVFAAPAAVFAQPQTVAAIKPSLSPDRLGAKGALTVTINYPNGTPSPMLRSVVHFPAGLGLEIPSLRSCSPARLQANGVSGCPKQSYLGNGHALVETDLGTQPVLENVALWAFLGPPQDLVPTIEIFAQGSAPIGEEVLLTATVLPDRAPYGEEMVMTVPSIPTLPSQPGASILNLSLTIGAPHHRARGANKIVMPSRCPVGGFPFAAEFTYASGSTGTANAIVPCPR